jgi:plasmid maintenance system killer protein
MPIFEGSFASKALKDFYYKGSLKKLPVKNADKLKNILDYLDTIDKLPPSPMLFRVHEHKGKGTWSFDINANMRVLCEFDEDTDPINIRIEDPH